jgi:phenylpropionate dioxygenase-like ring-hydroxylating dioxygenase large terminal subunit
MFLKNGWYVAAWDSEIGETPLARTICGEPVMFFRGANGKVVALEDRCCHRNLPLSMGTVEGDCVRCGYHGLKFDQTGNCVEVPGQKHIPPNARVRRYPLIERWKMLWIWAGEGRADEGMMPHWQGLDDPRFVSANGNGEKPIPMRCNWQLNNDNLLDLSHVFYVHKTTLGGTDKIYPIKHGRSANGVSMFRWLPNIGPIPVFARYLNMAPDASCDRWQGTNAELPTHCDIDVGFAPAGQLAEDDVPAREKFVRLHAFITATPETENTSFMFYVQSRNFDIDNAELTRRMVGDFRRVFDEDVAVMEGQQRTTDARPNAPTVDIIIDAPPLAMRRLVQDRMAAENRPSAPIRVAAEHEVSPVAAK